MSALFWMSQRWLRVQHLSALAGLLAIVAMTGCGGEHQVKVYPVKGQVKFGSEIPVGAQIVLHSQSDNGAGDVAPTGTVKEDGTFAISTYGDADGAPAGDYVATIEWFKVVNSAGGTGRGPNVLPPTYASRDTSPIKVTVASAPTELPPIEVTKR